VKILQHKPILQFSCFEKSSGKVILKLITEGGITGVSVIYGDPYLYVKSTNKDKHGNDKWDWKYSEIAMEQQYSSNEEIMWRAAVKPPKVKRMKYAFILSSENSRKVYYGENGVSTDIENLMDKPFNFFFYPFIHDVDAPHVPAWAEDTCWYQIFPERFCNGDPSISPPKLEAWENTKPTYRSFYGGDLRGIINKLQYLQELGITGIYMTPVFLSSSNHKYNTQDYFEIDPHFGDKETLKELVKKAHDVGIKIMLDIVYNHIGSEHKFWQDVLLNQEKSEYKDYFHIRSFPVKTSYKNYLSLNFDAFSYIPEMPKWNTENPEARRYLIDAALYWIKEFDVDGYRFDVSDEVSFDFWNELGKEIYALKPDFYLLGEIWHDPTKWLGKNCFDAVMNYPLGRAIESMFISGSCDPDTFNNELMTMLMRFSDMHTKAMFNLMDSHDTTRILTQANGDKLAVKNALLFMYMMKGAPCIYYGTEIGMEGGHDPDCRRPMIWDKKKQDLELFAFFKQLLSLRKRYNKLIQNAAISYTREKSMCRWELLYNKKKLFILYNSGEKELSIDGKVLMATKNTAPYKLPAKTLAVVRAAVRQ